MTTFAPNIFKPHRLLPYPCNLDKVSDEFVQAVDHNFRIDRRLPPGNSSVVGQGRTAQSNRQGHPAQLLCLGLGPLVFALTHAALLPKTE